MLERPGTRGRIRPRSPDGLLAFREEDREEHDAFGEGGAQDGLNQDRGGGAGVASDGFGSLGTDQTDADRGSERGETDVDVSGEAVGNGFAVSAASASTGRMLI